MFRSALLVLPLALLLTGCFVVIEPDNPPDIVIAEAGCLTDQDTGEDYWLLDARVTHPDNVGFEAAWVEVADEDGYDLGNVSLQRLEPGYFAREVESNPAFLDCDWPFAYYFLFIVEDDNGLQDEELVIN